MTALAEMKLSTTLLADLPGNKMSNTGATKQPFQYRKCLQIKVRRTAPSEHFIKASDKESNGDDSSSTDDEDDLSTSRTTTNLNLIGDSTSNFKPFKMTIPSALTPSKIPAISKKTIEKSSSSSDESDSSDSFADRSDAQIQRKREIPSTLRYHAWSESLERRLLDHLIDYDEDEDNRVNGIQSDEEAYLMWKCGEDLRRTSKAGSDMIVNKRAKTSKLSSRGKNQPFNQQTKKDTKPDVFCGWETLYNKKPIQKLKEERKQRLSQPNANLYTSKFSIAADRGANSSAPYTFFHYTDIARYIQQYRVNHACENPCPNFPACSHEMSMQDLRDVSFPFKFDLSTNSIRSRAAYRGVLGNARGMRMEPAPGDEVAGMRTGNAVNAGYLSPVSFRPPYALKSPSGDNWNYLPESPSRLKYQLKKIWRSYEQKSLNSNAESKNNEDAAAIQSSQRPLSDLSQAVDVNTSSSSNKNDATIATNTTRTIESPNIEQNSHAINDAGDKRSVAISHFREVKLKENCLQVREEAIGLQHTSGSIFELGDTQGLIDAKERYELEKNKRMKSLIVAEINSLQRKQIITIEQKRKLDKFKEALSAMSSGPLDSKANLPPSGSATKRFIAGSVRAYYNRTTNGRLIDNLRTDSIKCAPDLDFDSNIKSDDKPIILVSQPHLRHLANKPQKPEPPLLGKKLIGGRVVERSAKHPADAKQFTRITDLLRIKERQQSGRCSLTGSARSSPIGSATRKRTAPHSRRHKQKANGNLFVEKPLNKTDSVTKQ